MKKVLLLAAALLLTACSQAPGAGDMKDILTRQYQRQLGPDAVLVRNLKKVDGKAEGKDRYLVDVKYDLVFLKGFDQLSQQAQDKAKDGQWLGAVDQGLNLWQLRMTYGDVKSGDVKHVAKRYKLVKTDAGWDLADNWPEN
ncbi:hypothetical protein [Gallaecimonas mangrovi]|uniref:hypothetical protein n=1 Tax=Gallaecimonas mangrovi TaxID=2291597 RepID=UPI000E2040E5|nr:hypothetical protein [Gallaecimonas mangrovi]